MTNKIKMIAAVAALSVWAVCGGCPPYQVQAAAQPTLEGVLQAGRQMPQASTDGMQKESERNPQASTDGMQKESERNPQALTDGMQKESEAPGQPVLDSRLREEGKTLRQARPDSILPAPEQLTATKIAYNVVTLTWSAVADAAGYQIEYSVDGQTYTVAGKVAAEVLTYKCKKLSTGTEYRLRVCALDKNNKAGNYSSATAQPCLKKPKIIHSAVSELKAAVIEWKKVSGAQKYELHRKAKGEAAYTVIAETAELSYTDEDIAAGLVYMYRVRAVREVEQKTVYSKYSKAVETAITMPAIELVSCEANNHYSINLGWQQSDSVTGYYIYRSTKEDGTYKKIKDINNHTTVSYTDTGVVPGKTFYYKICGYVQSADASVLTGELSASKMAQTQMAAPNLTGVKSNFENRSLVLSWEQYADVTGFRVFRSQYPDKKFKKIADVSGALASGYEDRSVAPGAAYYYRIRALYETKKYKGKSQPSNVQKGDMAPGAPNGLKIRQTAADALHITWDKPAGAFSYNLYRAASSSGDYTCIAQGLQEAEYTDTQLKDNRTYYYRVSAVGTGGEGRRCFAVSYLIGGVSLNTRTLKLCVGDTKTLELSTYRQGKAVWKSADAQIAKVDSEGGITGVGVGTTEVTATVAGKSAKVIVTVTPGVKNGIDVSRWQEEVNWSRVKDSGIDFAFLRISNHYLEDFTFETKYQDAAAAGMPLGVYCYSRATTVAEAEEEARTVLQILNNRKLEYPIAMDMEDAVHKSAGMAKETLHQMILAFKQVVENAGYQFVLYSYQSFFDTNLDKTQLDGIDLWIARYRSLKLGSGYTGTGNEVYWQYNSGQYSGSDFHVDGITDAAGNLVEVDVNVEYQNKTLNKY